MTKHLTNYRHWRYAKEDDYAIADYKTDAIENFERFWKRKINPEEVKEFLMRDDKKSNYES